MWPASSNTFFVLLLLVIQITDGADLTVSGVQCGATEFEFVGESCVNQTHFLSFAGNCTDGALLEDVEMSSCFDQTDGNGPYCHECSGTAKNLVCSNSEDSTEACSDQCGSATYGYAFVDYCSDESVWLTSEVKCVFGGIEQVFAASGSCSASTPETPACLDCGPIGVCAEASATCEGLGLDGGSESTNDSGSSDFGGSLFATSGGISLALNGIVGFTVFVLLMAVY